jgi:hypothetical protein
MSNNDNNVYKKSSINNDRKRDNIILFELGEISNYSKKQHSLCDNCNKEIGNYFGLCKKCYRIKTFDYTDIIKTSSVNSNTFLDRF